MGCTVTVVDERWVNDEMESGRRVLAVLSEHLPKRTEERRTARVMDLFGTERQPNTATLA